MKRLSFFTFLLIGLLIVVPAFAQEDLDASFEWMEYGLTIDYPGAWLTAYYPDSNFYAILEDQDDMQNLTLDPHGQVLVMWPIEGSNLDSIGDNPEDVVDSYASSNIDGFRSRDIDTFETENGLEMVIASGDISGGAYLIVASTTGPDDDLFMFLGISPSRDSDDLEDNVRAMLDTLELEIPQDIIESGRADDATAIEYGETAQGEIDNRTPSEEYVFEGEAGDIISISLTATSSRDNLDTLLILINQDGREIARNDDINTAGGNYNSQISGFVLPDDGTYLIIATRFQQENGESTGEYELTLNLRVLGEGEEILAEEGEITNRRPSEEYEFDGNAGDIVTITMIDTSQDQTLDSQVILLDEDGNELARNDDAFDSNVGRLNSQIFAYELPEDGTYTVVATRYQEADGSSVGEYEVSVVVYAAEDIQTTEQGTGDEQDSVLEYGETIQGEIDDENFQQIYTFEGSEGDIVTITMIDVSAEDSLDPLLILLDPAGTEVTRNDDGDSAIVGQFNSQIRNLTLPADGTYTIIATRFSQETGTTVGEYELSLVEGELESGGK
ncbi:MAG: PPC domain-containing protein [Anaerolineae bacterium]